MLKGRRNELPRGFDVAKIRSRLSCAIAGLDCFVLFPSTGIGAASIEISLILGSKGCFTLPLATRDFCLLASNFCLVIGLGLLLGILCGLNFGLLFSIDLVQQSLELSLRSIAEFWLSAWVINHGLETGDNLAIVSLKEF